MSDRGRELPPWMSKKEKEKEKERVKGPLKSRRKPKIARSVFYCMNEKELVEAAVSYLTNCARGALQSEHKTEPRPAEMVEEARTSHPAAEASSGECSDSADAQDRSYVSESDLDITEVETLPYMENEEAEGGDQVREARDNQEERRDVNKDGSSQGLAASRGNEDDALRLVREIFFT